MAIMNKYLLLESDDSRFTKISKTFGMIGIGIACVPGIFLAIPGAIIGGIYAKGKNWRGVQTDNNANISMSMGAGALIGAGIFLAPCFIIGRCVGAAVGAIADPKGAYKAAKSALSSLYNAAKKIFPSSKNQSNSPSILTKLGQKETAIQQNPSTPELAKAREVGNVLTVSGVTENNLTNSNLTPRKKSESRLIDR